MNDPAEEWRSGQVGSGQVSLHVTLFRAAN